MYCKNCGKELKDGEEFCSKCGTKIKIESKRKTITVINVFCVIAVIIVLLLIYGIKGKTHTNNNISGLFEIGLNKEEKGFEQASANIQANGAQFLSFNNMNSDDDNFTEIQQEIIDYFDNDYMLFSVRNAQRYPKVFEDAKVTTVVTIEKVLNSTDKEYEVLAKEHTITMNDTGEFYGETKDEQLLLISGNQLNKRLVAGDQVYVYGRYKGVQSIEVDGISHMVSKIQANSVLEAKYSMITGIFKSRYSYKTIKDVAEYIFGKDIKISEIDVMSNEDEILGEGNYKIVLDNQSNSNFKAFIMNEGNGGIYYASKENNLTSNITKELFVAADFKHYIVTTYDSNSQHIYIEYFDNNFKKIWSREFDYASTKAFSSPMDYTEDKMALMIDNDLYLIDLLTGENIIEPVIVGEKIKINMMSDGVVLIGDNNKDTIMKVDYTGKVLFKLNADTDMEEISHATTQIVNGRLIIKLQGMFPVNYDGDWYSGYRFYDPTKYIVINNDGSIEISTEDLDGGYLLI